MKRKATLIGALKQSITEARDSEIFVQGLYESSNFNSNIDTDYVLSNFYAKSAYQNSDYHVSHSEFKKEKMNAHFELGRKYAKVFTKTKLKLKE
jgi:phage anti-repressor protein